MELGHILWPSDPVTRESSDPLALFYNERKYRAMTSLTSRRSVLRPNNFLIIIGKSKSSLRRLTSSDFSPTTDTWQWLLSSQHFKCTFCILGIFFENRKNSDLTPGQNDDPVTRTWKITHWPGDPLTQFHVCSSSPRLSLFRLLDSTLHGSTKTKQDRFLVVCDRVHISHILWAPKC